MLGPFILMYHSIADNSDDPYAVSVDSFKKQIAWLSENGYEIVPLSYLVSSLQAGQVRSLHKKVVITFDDGYADFISNALPVLLDHKAPATVFLVTAMLGQTSSWNKSAPHDSLMTEADARYIKTKDISLGSHTADHVNLTLVDEDGLEKQLKASYDTLSILGETFHAFSYPWGQWSPQVGVAVKSAGYQCALAVGQQTRIAPADLFRLPRVTLGHHADLAYFQSVLTRSPVAMAIRFRCQAIHKTISGIIRRQQR